MSVRKRIWTTAAGERRIAWMADYSDQQGNRRGASFRTKREAEEHHSQVKVDVRAGIHTAPSASVDVTHAAASWLEFVRLEGRERSTLDQYEQHVRLHIVPRLGRTKLAKLTTPRINEFRDELLSNLSRPLAKAVLVSLKAILKDAQRRGSVAQNVARDVKIGSSGRDKRKLEVGRDIPTVEEIRAIVAVLPARWRPLLLTAIFTGLRASELRGLRWADIDLKSGELHVKQRADRFNQIGLPKSAHGTRTVPLPPNVVNVLRAWKLQCPASTQGLAFPTSRGTVLRHENIVRNGLMPAMRRAGLLVDNRPKYTGLHALRHFYASWCVNRVADGGLGLPIKTVQARLGHASIVMTADTYGHLFPRTDDGRELAQAERLLLGTAT